MIVTVVWATRELQDVVPVEVPAGATLAEAVDASGLIRQYQLDPQRIQYALYGTRVVGDRVLAPGDRIEIVGPLIVEPKVARARRARVKEKNSQNRSGR